MFKPVNPKVDIQKLEREQMDFWRVNKIFERTMTEREGKPTYVFYEGPPTANGRPGSHHVLARAFKDMFPRYKTMRGFYCLRKGGWDTHGLPVEIEVQKELGLKSKAEIEAYGVAEFNERCRASVFRYITDWERLTERIAYWVDLDNAYVTFTNDYIESIWYILKQFWQKGLLFRGYKVVPYSPSSGTPLSSHEVSLGYKEIDDPSVYVRFPLRDKPGVYFLAWTTTPWTLPGNVALAVGGDVQYVQVEIPLPDGEGTEQLILAEALVDRVLKIDPEQRRVVKRFKGKDLAGTHYNPLYTFLPVEGNYAYVTVGDFVSTEDGTGIVHIAPAYGADDMGVAEKYGLPMLHTVVENGRFVDAVTPFRGMWFKDADRDIIKDLKTRGLMYRSETYRHTYPHNWRDNTPLMYYARQTWFIRATEYREKMIALNNTINWTPDHVREGRFGNWLEDLKDWALGRERYWGTPLPVWVDDQTGEMLCVGSVAELSQLAGRDLTDLDLHRPYVDDITFPNPSGKGGTMRRVPEVIDVWFDSGAMPLSQWGYPHRNRAMFDQQFPADYICEAVDQTRGWFYSLHAISTMLNEQVAFKNVICLGHILDEKGEKMSKSKGNIVNPWDVLDKHGADAFRWYMYTATAPGEPRRFSSDLVGEVVTKFWLTLWNTYSFFVTYANIDGWTPGSAQPPVSERDELDRWILSELHQLTRQVTEAFESYDATGATRPIQAFVDVLSNWYVRLSRRRFWKSESDTDKLSAYATLYECLVTVSKLIAPTMPFLSEALYRNLVAQVDAAAPQSVHLALWPAYDEPLIDRNRIAEMRLVQRLVSLGRAAREKVKIGVRQPLLEAQFVTRDPQEATALEKMAEMIGAELNVKKVTLLGEPTYKLNPLPAVLGKKFGKSFPRIQKMLREGERADVQRWAKALRAGETLTLELDGEMYQVTPEECEVQMQAGEGSAFAEEGGYMAVIDTTMTDDLIREGLAREVVRRVQTMRRDADFDIADHITVRYTASDKLQTAIQQFADYIRDETLTEQLEQGDPDDGFFKQDFALDDETLLVGIKRIAR
jgi:isoleucyl-tRNA synthetase